MDKFFLGAQLSHLQNARRPGPFELDYSSDFCIESVGNASYFIATIERLTGLLMRSCAAIGLPGSPEAAQGVKREPSAGGREADAGQQVTVGRRPESNRSA